MLYTGVGATAYVDENDGIKVKQSPSAQRLDAASTYAILKFIIHGCNLCS